VQSTDQLLPGEGLRLPFPEIAPADVQHDAVEPALKALPVAEMRQGKIGLQHRLLRQLLRGPRVPYHAERDALRHRLMALEQRVECRLVAGPRPRDQLRVCPLLHRGLCSSIPL
jgi:hypothetical protein